MDYFKPDERNDYSKDYTPRFVLFIKQRIKSNDIAKQKFCNELLIPHIEDIVKKYGSVKKTADLYEIAPNTVYSLLRKAREEQVNKKSPAIALAGPVTMKKYK